MRIGDQEVTTTTVPGKPGWTVKGIEIIWQGGINTAEPLVQPTSEKGIRHEARSTSAPTVEAAVELAYKMRHEWSGDDDEYRQAHPEIDFNVRNKERRFVAVVIAPDVVTTHTGFLIDLEKATGDQYKTLREYYEGGSATMFQRSAPRHFQIPIPIVRAVRRVEYKWTDGQKRLRHIFLWDIPRFSERQQEKIKDFFANYSVGADFPEVARYQVALRAQDE